MFNLLVSGVAGAWEAEDLYMQVDRFNKYSGKSGIPVKIDDPDSLRQLENCPALLMYELGVHGQNASIVRHGRLRNVARYGQVVSFEMELDSERPYLAREKIVNFAPHLDMHPFEQGHTHWAVKDGDLPPMLLNASFRALSMPLPDADNKGLTASFRGKVVQRKEAAPSSRIGENAETDVADSSLSLPDGARVVCLIVGLENYRTSPANQIASVEFARADAEAFKVAIEELFEDSRPDIVLLLDEQATEATVRSEIKARIWSLGPDDLFIFYYAGHGFHDATGNRLTVWDTALINVEGTTLSISEHLLAPLRDGHCKRILAFIDACASRFKPVGRRVVTPMDTAEFGELLKSAEYCGVFLSCRPGQESFPDKELGHGIWTYYLLKALKGEAEDAFAGRFLTNASLQDYLRQEVARHVSEHPRIRGIQTPEALVTATNTFAIRRLVSGRSIVKPTKSAPVAPDSMQERYSGSSTQFFAERFAQAFPGVRGIRWFDDAEDICRRLTRLLRPPIVFANGAPFWWWANGNLQIEKFQHVSARQYLMDFTELEITRIAAVTGHAYWGHFVYFEVAAMPATKANGQDAEGIARSVELRGYAEEEYGIVDGKIIVSREEYDDGAAEIDGQLTDIRGRVVLRTRYLTPYNFLLAPNQSPINNSDFDERLVTLLRAALKDDSAFETLVTEVRRLPRRDNH